MSEVLQLIHKGTILSLLSLPVESPEDIRTAGQDRLRPVKSQIGALCSYLIKKRIY
jgi:hypothetical protein